MTIYYKYLGGAHGTSGYYLKTYSLEKERHLVLANLFENWEEVKGELFETFLFWWNERKQSFLKERIEPGEDTYHLADMVEFAGENLREELGEDLGQRSFVFTSSEVGTRINIYFQTSTLGPTVAGGSWISLPIGHLSDKLYTRLNYELPKVSKLGRFFDRPSYLGLKTKHILANARPRGFDREFFFHATSLDLKEKRNYYIGQKLIEIGDSRGLFEP